MLRPLPRRLGVVLIPDPDKSKGGIYIPEQAKERADQGIVKYIGEDCEEFEVGDYVLFSAYNGTIIQVEDEGSVTILHKDFIACKLDPPNTQVPGLYYRDKKGWENLESSIRHYLDHNLTLANATKAGEIVKLVAEANPYFNADYETVISLCSHAYQNHPFHRTTRIGWTHGSKLDNRDV